MKKYKLFFKCVMIIFHYISIVNLNGQAKHLLFHGESGPTIVNTSTSVISYVETPLVPPPNAHGAISHAEDLNGNILFYTTASGVFMADGTQMPGSIGMFSYLPATEISICQMPGERNKFYVIYQDSPTCGNIYYSIVDISLNEGLGDVIELNTLLLTGLYSEGKEIIRIPDSDEYWFLIYKCTTGILRYKIDANGINIIPEEIIAITHTGAYTSSGELDYHNGKLIYSCILFNKFVLADFNPNTGIASNIVIVDDVDGYGCEFSPNNTKVYFTHYSSFANPILTQYDIGTGALTSFDLPTCNNYTWVGSIELGRDQNLYTISGDRCIIKIENADSNTPIFTSFEIQNNIYTGISDYFLSLNNYKLSVTSTITHNECNDKNTGSITLNIENALAPLLIEWSHDSNEVATTIENLPGGEYTVNITSGDSDPYTETFIILQPSAITANHTLTQPLCYGDVGKIIITDLSGGTPPYEIDWKGINPNNISAGTYSYSISDQNGCTIESSYQVNEPKEIISRVAFNQPDCNNVFATAEIIIDGGNPPYEIDWTGKNPERISPGEFTVIISDANGCHITENYTYAPTDIKMFASNTFTPNGDGLNDSFMPSINCYNTFELFIFDRWGKQIFYSNDIDRSWDGTFRGIDLPQSKYIYKLQVIGPYKKIKKFNGIINLVR